MSRDTSAIPSDQVSDKKPMIGVFQYKMTIYGKDEIANDLIIDIKQSVLAFPNVNYIKR